MPLERDVITDGVTTAAEREEIRNWLFDGWRELHPEALTEDDWIYLKHYYSQPTSVRLDILSIQDPALLAAIEKAAAYRFSYLLEYAYHFKPLTPDLELITVFHKDTTTHKSSFKIRVGFAYRYVVYGTDMSEDEFDGYMERLETVRYLRKPVASL